MSKDESTSIIDLEGTYRTTDVELPEVLGAPVKADRKIVETQREKPVSKVKKEKHSKTTEPKVLQNRLQQIMKNHAEERRSLQKEIKDQARRSREDLGKALKQTEKNYHVQLEHLRQDYDSQSIKLQNELESFLAGKMTEMKEHNEKVVLTDSQERLDKLQEWLHGEFVTELQSKTNELEQTKASSDTQMEKLVHEVDRKNQEIVFLQNKIKEISHHLKKGMRQDLLDDLGLKDDLKNDEKKKKPHKKGFFAKFGAMF